MLMTCCYITSEMDCTELQNDVNIVHHWTIINVMKNANIIPEKTPKFTPHDIDSRQATLGIIVTTYRYLGVVISSDLSWSSHIQETTTKAKQIIGMLYRNISKFTTDRYTMLYKSLIRPHLEYAAEVWSPHTVKNVQMIEKVQIFALRMCAQDYRLSYEELLKTFGLPSLENRRIYLSLCRFHNIVCGVYFFPSSFTSSSLQHSFKSSCDVLCTLCTDMFPTAFFHA